VVKLLDFGVALMDAQTRLTQSGILVGTINYVAPEQITKNLYSPAGDIYAMGMIFYEMLVGQSAFPRVTLTEVVEKILAEIPEPAINLRPDIPAELNRLVMRLLAKEPAQRPGAENILSHLKKIEHFNGA
jgi:serine/threonine protein kinase